MRYSKAHSRESQMGAELRRSVIELETSNFTIDGGFYSPEQYDVKSLWLNRSILSIIASLVRPKMRFLYGTIGSLIKSMAGRPLTDFNPGSAMMIVGLFLSIFWSLTFLIILCLWCSTLRSVAPSWLISNSEGRRGSKTLASCLAESYSSLLYYDALSFESMLIFN